MDTWTFVFLMVGLKIPVVLLLSLVWWAVHQTTDVEPEVSDDGGSKRPRNPHPRGPLPRHPRRGAHGERAPQSPQRVRSVVSRVGDRHRAG